MKLPLQISVALVLVAGAADAQAQMRFRGMDSNGDGMITREEWRGSDRAFRNQDWDGDGVLAGEEVRRGARRQDWTQDWNRDGRVDQEDRQIAQRFRGYDMNNDGRVTVNEWPGNQRLFARLDANRDRVLTVQEYTQGAGFRLDAQGGPAFGFSNLDHNRDGWITRNEWNMAGTDFGRLDANRDNRISRFEFENDTTSAQDTYSPAQFTNFDGNRDGWITRREWRGSATDFHRFDTNNDNRISRFEYQNITFPNQDLSAFHDRFLIGDVNHDGWLSRSEWRGREAVFTRLDRNRDNRLSRMEYNAELDTMPQTDTGTSSSGPRSAAWRMGYDRGIQEGMVAGRNDYNHGRGWDLEGQRELVSANSGYRSDMGSLNDYQAGYREGFRNAYRAGFLEARDNGK